ncbi:MAG: hypothetical protein JEY71_03650 [Sphaerochaeta sp.]|nr:hypothetical protein [Sphaerochaeta sp.]
MANNTSENLLIGFDLGTSAVKAVLSDTEGNVIGQASRKVHLICTEEGFIELDAQFYYEEICSICRELVSLVPEAKNIRAICFSGATGNTLLLDGEYKPLIRAISWMDMRSVGMDEVLYPGFDLSSVYDKMGWPYGGTFPLAHLGWVKNHKPELWKEAKHFSMLNDFLYYKLCGRLVVDYSKASTFFLQNQIERKWDEDILNLLGIEEKRLPSLVAPGTSCGKITQVASEETGLDGETVVVTGSFDHPSAARSVGIFKEGELLISAGTSWVIFTPIRDRNMALKGSMLVDPFLSPSGCWGAMFALTAITKRMDEYLENCIGSSSTESVLARFDRLASEAEIGTEGLFLNPLQQPYADMKEKIQNIKPKNIARALMEGVVFMTRYKLEKLIELTGKPISKIVFTGGPTKSPIWSTILADVLQQTVVIPEIEQHSGAMGAVIMAGIGSGLYSDESEGFERVRSGERVIEPDQKNSQRYQKIYIHYKKQFELH